MQITLLDKEKYKGFNLDFKFTTKFYYDIIIDPNEIFSIKLVKKQFEKELHKGFT